MEVTASAEGSPRFSATAGFGAAAAYLLHEADIAPCGRDSAVRPLASTSLRLGLARPQSGGSLSRAPLARSKGHCGHETSNAGRLLRDKTVGAGGDSWRLPARSQFEARAGLRSV